MTAGCENEQHGTHTHTVGRGYIPHIAYIDVTHAPTKTLDPNKSLKPKVANDLPLPFHIMDSSLLQSCPTPLLPACHPQPACTCQIAPRPPPLLALTLPPAPPSQPSSITPPPVAPHPP